MLEVLVSSISVRRHVLIRFSELKLRSQLSSRTPVRSLNEIPGPLSQLEKISGPLKLT